MDRSKHTSLSITWQQLALAGATVWGVWAVVFQPAWTAVLLLLAPFVIVPLGLRIATQTDTGPDLQFTKTLANIAPVVAISGAASFAPDPGLTAAVLSIPWMFFTIGIAMTGLGRLLSRNTLNDPGIGTDAGLIFVAVGGIWLTISRAGLNPLGFSDAIVQLTAVHFHYAGFALPIVAGVTASRLGRSVAIPLAVIVSVPLTAVGITAGGWLEWIAATTMAVAGMSTALLITHLSGHYKSASRWLLPIAATALFAGMCLALGWSWSIAFDWNFLGLQSMAAMHGSLNALGFGLLGLIGLNLAPLRQSDNEALASLHLGQVPTATLDRLALLSAGHKPTNPVGLLHRRAPPGFKRKVWSKPVANNDFAAAVEAIRTWSGHANAGIQRSPQTPAIAVGQTLALGIPAGPLTVTATSRIIEIVDEPDRFGFTYTTLPHHPEDGEESFTITRTDDGQVTIEVVAVWRPATLANHLCPPVTRFLQNRAINKYLDGIAGRSLT